MTAFVKSGQTQLAHDALLAVMPAGATHEPCDLCSETKTVKEVAQVADADRTYTEAEHLALAADAVKRETASLTEAKEAAATKVTELSSKVDVLESEKASLTAEKEAAVKALEDFKAEVERAKEIESAKSDRKAKVKAANASLADAYFTDERVQRWAEMTEEAFTAFLEDIAPAAVGQSKETAAFAGGESPTDPGKPTVGLLFAARRGEKN
jgi:chromosome segregation ATPase